MKTASKLSLFFLLQLITLSLMASLRFINLETTITLTFFNLLFATLIFQLNGSTTRKMSMLAMGNLTGFFWNLVFYYLASTGTAYFGKTFTALYTIIYPLLNLMWIVPFWSLSLSFLAKPQNPNTEEKPQ
jgi:hypothetical protein